VWLSEIMLQQTRVEAAIPYFLKFLERFPTLGDLAGAEEPAVLAAWSGLGYYSRARNLHRAAKAAAASPPNGYEAVRELPGIGPYTAAAVASIVFGEPYAAVDGNVIRVVSRLTNDAGEVSAGAVKERLGSEAQRLLDPKRPGDFNQALMELGATVCVPGAPKCGVCPVERHCEGRAAGRERELPVKARKPAARDIELDLAIFRREGEVLLVQRGAGESRLAGFWELPEGEGQDLAGRFTHRIVNDRFRVRVWLGGEGGAPEDGRWFEPARLGEIPLTTVSRKALQLVHNFSLQRALEY
jgi:A/G-specific adenine glycosylase